MGYYSFICLFVLICLGYFIGSIPFSIIVSKVFYKIDIRDYGSHNAGGTNIGRVIGKKASIFVIILDLLKMLLVVWGSFFFVEYVVKDSVYSFNFWNMDHYSIYAYLPGLACCLGHSFPFYCDFRGGKSVAVYIGFLIATNLYLLFVAVLSFFTILAVKKIVSLSSILTTVIVNVCTIVLCILSYFVNLKIALGGFAFSLSLYFVPDFIYLFVITFMTVFVICRHKENIKRLLNHTEPITRYKRKGVEDGK